MVSQDLAKGWVYGEGLQHGSLPPHNVCSAGMLLCMPSGSLFPRKAWDTRLVGPDTYRARERLLGMVY